MAEKKLTPGAKDNTAFGIVLTLAERTGKVIAVVTVTSYVIGYVVTSARLDQAGVATTSLIDAQYLAAGLSPGILLWLTVLVVLSAYYYDPRVQLKSLHQYQGRRLKSSWWYALWSLLILFATGIIVQVLVGIARGRWGDFAQSLLSISDQVIKLSLMELALWYLVAGLTSKVLWELLKDLKNLGEGYTTSGVAFILIPLALVVFGIIVAVSMPNRVYIAIPQSFGGGKPHFVHLYVDRSKVPVELLDATANAQNSSADYTIPLNLIFQTPTEYIVRRIEDGEGRAWVLKANVVYAVVKEPEK